jgi:hypothetical protein
MTRPNRRPFALVAAALMVVHLTPLGAQAPSPDWTQVEVETMRHFQALLRLDTSNPPGTEGIAVDYLKAVLD